MAESKIKNDRLVVKEFSKEYTVGANTVAPVDFTPTLANHTALGVVGFSTNHGSVLIQQCRFINATTVRFSVRNFNNTAITTTAIILVLFQPN